MEHRLCNMTLMGVVQRAEQAEARLAELEGALNWLTSCLNCASLLDSSYADYVRAEKAEAERDKAIERADRAQAALDAIDREVRWHETGASWGPSHTLRQVREHLRKAKTDDPA